MDTLSVTILETMKIVKVEISNPSGEGVAVFPSLACPPMAEWEGIKGRV
jgi:hypothetical protein